AAWRAAARAPCRARTRPASPRAGARPARGASRPLRARRARPRSGARHRPCRGCLPWSPSSALRRIDVRLGTTARKYDPDGLPGRQRRRVADDGGARVVLADDRVAALETGERREGLQTGRLTREIRARRGDTPLDRSAQPLGVASEARPLGREDGAGAMA